jgi:glycosyltransferase involved in cell wall biosynthesis
VWRELELHTADLMVLVPAKALPHKRLDRALEIGVALRRVCRRPKVLITAGPSPHEPDGSARLLAGLRSAIARLDLESTVHVLADLIRSGPGHGTIRDLMLLCDVVLLPSDEEGFGLPLWEAAALRVPIVCSNIAVFHEIAGDAAVFVGHETEDVAVARAIAALAHSPRNRLRREALASRASFAEALDRLLPAGAQPNV